MLLGETDRYGRGEPEVVADIPADHVHVVESHRV
jgi:hypothetical protein